MLYLIFGFAFNLMYIRETSGSSRADEVEKRTDVVGLILEIQFRARITQDLFVDLKSARRVQS